MDFRVGQDVLAKSLGIVGRAVSTKTTLPILNMILFQLEDAVEGDGQRLRLAATNLELHVVQYVAVDSLPPQSLLDVETGKTFAHGVALPARILTEFIATLSGEGKDAPIDFHLNPANLTMSIQCARSGANIKGMDGLDFPLFPTVADTRSLAVMSGETLKQMVAQTVFAASGDQTRPVLTGVFLELNVNTLTAAAADSFRLAVWRTELDPELQHKSRPATHSLIIPGKSLLEISRVVTDKDEQVAISVTPNNSLLLFEIGSVQVITSLIEGNFPNYRAIIPASYNTRATVDTEVLTHAVRRAAIFAKDTSSKTIHLTIKPGADLTPGVVSLAATAIEVGDNKNEVDALVDGNETSISFNADYLKQALEAITTTQVALELKEGNSPGVLKQVGKDGYLHVIMPMHLVPTAAAPARPAEPALAAQA